MARVPISSGNLVDRQARSSTPIAAPDMTSGGRAIGASMQQFGGEVVQFGEQEDAIQAELDQAAAKKTDNAYAEWSRGRLWTGEGAFYQQEGFNAANARPALEKEIQAKRDEYLAGATSPRMRAMMQDALDRRMGADLEGISRHSTAQFGVEAKRQSVARQTNALNDAVTYFGDPVRFAQELEVGKSEIRSSAARDGAAPETMQGEVAAFESKVYAQVGSRLIRTGKIEDASAWIEANRGSMQAGDLEDLDAALYRPMLERQADGIVDDLLGYAPASTEGQTAAAGASSSQAAARTGGTVGGNLIGRMAHITGYAESRFNPNAVSPKGARGTMQVMPKTGQDPGYGVRPWDGSAKDNIRFGTDYLAALMKEYNNDPAKAWAAYNWGPGNLNDAVKKYGGDWLAHAPDETRGYVRGNMAALGGRGGAEVVQQAPREHDLAGALARLDALNLPFDVEQAARRQLMERVGTDERLLDRQRAQAVEQAETILDAAERAGKPITRESDIPASVWRTMGPSQSMQVRRVIERNAQPKARATDYGVYTQISDLYATDPAAFARLDPSSYRNALADGDYEKVIGWRRDVLKSASGNGGDKQVSIATIRSVTSQMRAANGLTTAGVKGTAAKAVLEKRIYNFETAVERGVELWQRGNPGKPISDSVVREIAERQLTKTKAKDSDDVRFWFERQTSPGASFTAYIPIADLNRLKAIGRRELGREPYPSELVTAYQTELEGR